jgi:SAM-dependent methyltransferase
MLNFKHHCESSPVDNDTIQRLNALNQDFYRITAENFSQTRNHPWPGWQKLLPYLDLQPVLSVLDVGCGNGRFAQFLTENLNTELNYTGLDANPLLLVHARQLLSTVDGSISLIQQDIIQHPPDSGQYDLVVLFGVIHHIPGHQNRQEFMHQLGKRVAPDGLLVFASWRFYDDPRFRERIVPWPDDFRVEDHDYLLDWRSGEHALRYCHFVDDTEHTDLIAATGLTELATYRADGKSGDLNQYSILRRS